MVLNYILQFISVDIKQIKLSEQQELTNLYCWCKLSVRKLCMSLLISERKIKLVIKRNSCDLITNKMCKCKTKQKN